MDEIGKRRLSILRKENQLSRILPNQLKQLVAIESKLEEAKILSVQEVEDLKLKTRAHNHETVFTKRAAQSNPKQIYEVLEIATGFLGYDHLSLTHSVRSVIPNRMIPFSPSFIDLISCSH